MRTARDSQDSDAPAASLPARGVIALTKLSAALSALLILAVLVIVTYAVFQRYVLETPLLWGDELLGYLLVAIVMLGAAEALRGNDHIAMDVFSARAGPRLDRWLRIWADLAVLAFAVVLGWSTWQSIRFAIDFGSYSVGHIEIATWIPQVPMLVGSALLGLIALTRILQGLLSSAPSVPR